MSRKELVFIASRTVALLQIIPALFLTLISLPEQLFLLAHNMHLRPVDTVEWVGVISTLVRVAALWVIASWFWRCGPVVERLFVSTGNQKIEPIE